MIDVLTIISSGLIAFLVAWTTIRAEESKGRAILYSLCCRYFIASFNSISQSTNKLSEDPIEKIKYISELEAILHELSALSVNPLFVRLVSNYELAPKMIVQIRREIIEHHKSNLFAMNQGTMSHFIEIYDWCLTVPWGFWLKKHKETEQLVNYFREWINNNTVDTKH